LRLCPEFAYVVSRETENLITCWFHQAEFIAKVTRPINYSVLSAVCIGY